MPRHNEKLVYIRQTDVQCVQYVNIECCMKIIAPQKKEIKHTKIVCRTISVHRAWVSSFSTNPSCFVGLAVAYCGGKCSSGSYYTRFISQSERESIS